MSLLRTEAQGVLLCSIFEDKKGKLKKVKALHDVIASGNAFVGHPFSSALDVSLFGAGQGMFLLVINADIFPHLYFNHL